MYFVIMHFLVCSSVLSVYLQKKVYQFLRHAFKHWPFDETFKYVRIVQISKCLYAYNFPHLAPDNVHACL